MPAKLGELDAESTCFFNTFDDISTYMLKYRQLSPDTAPHNGDADAPGTRAPIYRDDPRCRSTA